MKIQFVCLKFSKVFFLISCIFLILITYFLIQIINLNKTEEDFNNDLTNNIINKDNINSFENQATTTKSISFLSRKRERKKECMKVEPTEF